MVSLKLAPEEQTEPKDSAAEIQMVILYWGEKKEKMLVLKSIYFEVGIYNYSCLYYKLL